MKSALLIMIWSLRLIWPLPFLPNSFLSHFCWPSPLGRLTPDPLFPFVSFCFFEHVNLIGTSVSCLSLNLQWDSNQSGPSSEDALLLHVKCHVSQGNVVWNSMMADPAFKPSDILLIVQLGVRVTTITEINYITTVSLEPDTCYNL